ncbi:TetR/AcrR family transcriptional regulator [Sphaerisporangium flaviroseum]|uniref:TetR/AcrR family transcriptional regulator n=1 Tax=Sphaerisporangium flaviroseum TaxID=509199 RepID=A0ABP7I8Y3_9ACTN
MTVTPPVGDPAFEDLTARARIRDVALRLFAERGIEGATIRDIAKEAGVSAGLIRHHFGSKEGLREACDTHMLDRMMRIKEDAVLRGGMGDAGLFMSVHPTVLLGYRYFARAMVDGSPAAETTFDHMVDLGEEWLTAHGQVDTSDPRAYAAVLVAMQAGLLMMHDHVSRALGADVFTPEGSLRMIRAMVDFYSHALLSPELAAQAQAVLGQLGDQQPPTAAEPGSAGEGADDDRRDPH